MNPLLVKAPYKLTVAGEDYKINPSHRVIIHMVDVANDEDISDMDKPFILIKNLFTDLRSKSFFELRLMPEEKIVAFMEAMEWFLRRGEEEKPKDKKNKNAIVCFTNDARNIIDGFMKLNKNLMEEDMHWWEFLSRFAELPECVQTRKMYLRNQKFKNKLTKEEKKEWAEVGHDAMRVVSTDKQAINKLRKIRSGKA